MRRDKSEIFFRCAFEKSRLDLSKKDDSIKRNDEFSQDTEYMLMVQYGRKLFNEYGTAFSIRHMGLYLLGRDRPMHSPRGGRRSPSGGCTGGAP